jgi:uncharacterized protein (UPF0261 family)
MSIVIVGMLDEREQALALIKSCIEQRGYKTTLIDITVGTGAIIPTLKPDVSCNELAELAGPPNVDASGKKESATSVMTRGLRAKISALHASGELEGIIAITGMTGALITLPSMKSLPFGLPKLLISGATSLPVHAGLFSDYFALRDITVMNTVVDTVGMNALVRTLAVNGANAITGMVEGGRIPSEGKRSVAITEFGFCDKGAHYVREILEHEYEMVSFHATGLGDKAVIELVPERIFAGFVDLVPGAFSEFLLGGNRGIAGPDRLAVFSAVPIPYVFCPGGFDIISCGPLERKDKNDPLWGPRKLAQRKLYIQDPPRVQARMSPDESEYVGKAVAETLNRFERKARTKVVLPLKGFSYLSVEGGPLYDPDADRAFSAALKRHLDAGIDLVEVDSDINSPAFAEAVANTLSQAFRSQEKETVLDGGVRRRD